jgi:predicted nucleic acid-binding protein
MMRILIDTNILISAALSNKGTPFAAFKKAVTIIAKAMSLES